MSTLSLPTSERLESGFDAESLVAALASADAKRIESAMSACVRLHTRRISSYLRTWFSRLSCDQVDEIVNSSFVVLHMAWRRYDASRGDMASWLCGIARDLARTHLRRERAKKRASLSYHSDLRAMEGLCCARDNSADRAIERELRGILCRTMRSLPRLQRDALGRLALEGRHASPEEDAALAQRHGKTLGCVRVARFRARATVTRELERLGYSRGADQA